MDKKILIGGIVAVAIIGIAAFIIMQPAEQPTIEEANVIFDETREKTLALNSFIATTDGAFKIKDGEAILFGVELKDMRSSVINPFNFTEQDSSSVFTYNILINFDAITDFIEKTKTPKELEKLRAGGEMMGMDILAMMRVLGESNISVTMEMKSIDFDSYLKIVEIKGLREIVTDVAGVFAAEMVMGGVEENLGVWQKIPADSVVTEEMTTMLRKIEGLIPAMFDVFSVKEVLPNTEVNETPVYNFILDLDLDKMKNVVISVVPLLVEFAEEEVTTEKEKEMIAAINENWQEIVKVSEAMKIDSRVYICQETRFILQETGSVNMNLHELVVVLDSITREPGIEKTPEEAIEFAEMKEIIKNISIIGTINLVYSEHNTASPILAPTEYESVE